jgi:hypothetical protein
MNKSDIDYISLLEYFLCRSLDLKENLKNIEFCCRKTGGKSGAFFYYTANRQFVIKSINKAELYVIRRIIKDYRDRVTSITSSHLTRIFGVFRITIGTQEPILICIMENLSRNFSSPLIFDLKGSTYERRSTYSAYPNYAAMPREIVYKDIDFLNAFSDVCVGGNDGKEIMQALEADTELLEKHQIMDYSLLLFLEEIKGPKFSFVQSSRCFRLGELVGFVGIIDFLQNYSYRKKLENTINGLNKGKRANCSCVPPSEYRIRFLNLARKLFISKVSSLNNIKT